MKLDPEDYDVTDDFRYNGYDAETYKPAVYVGFMVDLLDRITDLLGLEYRLFPVKDNQYGFLRDDGTWDGMIGEVAAGNMDIAAAPMFITEQRSSVVDFSRPFLSVQATVLMRRPSVGSSPVIRTPLDLTRQRRMLYGTQKGGMVWRALRKSNSSLYHDIWLNMRSFDSAVFTSSNEEGVSKVRRGGYAYLLPHTIGHYISQQQPCDLVAVGRFLMNENFALAVQKGAGLLDQLDRVLGLLDEEGFLEQLYQKYWFKRSQCSQSSKMYGLNSTRRIHQNIAMVTALALIHVTMTTR
ncbi:hypothetical protein CAPTEDRAFT_128327 [Capitella teleta]|uniref:Ionotropic glutamate receptor L-glutamate and glycine-binding domain-containing protein n=1 Tax=Capitella teleta TaxID=283909 RepID=R7UUL3_CAPTE|nr:hypothetical protein CAPTEDRAFT_128327 [Capitella teleta]|eukprot:ELU09885.1 hypothetical protein CAPTEDRAFT_128327 [Capitella teleta]